MPAHRNARASNQPERDEREQDGNDDDHDVDDVLKPAGSDEHPVGPTEQRGDDQDPKQRSDCDVHWAFLT